MSREDAPRPYLENLIVPEIKTNKQSAACRAQNQNLNEQTNKQRTEPKPAGFLPSPLQTIFVTSLVLVRRRMVSTLLCVFNRAQCSLYKSTLASWPSDSVVASHCRPGHRVRGDDGGGRLLVATHRALGRGFTRGQICAQCMVRNQLLMHTRC
jgi:hypothetical protein